MTTDKIYWPGDPAAPEGAKVLRPAQVEAIMRTMAEPTRAAVWGSEMDTGKTVCAIEFMLRMGFQRVLVVGVKDTYQQWADRLAAQSDGAAVLLRIDDSAAGKRNFKALISGEPGLYFGGSQYLAAQDWERLPTTDEQGQPIWERKRSTNEVVTRVPTKAEPIGPRLYPKQEMRRHHVKVYSKMAPLDALIVDEVHVVANRKTNGNGTLKILEGKKGGPQPFKLGMSGTFVGNRFENAWGVTSWAWPSFIDNSFIRWRAEWCALTTPYGKGGEPVTDGSGRPVLVVTGERNPGQFVKSLPCYIRLPDPLGPAPEPFVFEVPMLPQQKLDYEALEEDGLVWLRSHTRLEPLVTNLPIAKRTRLRTAALGTMSFDAEGEIVFDEHTESTKLWALRQVLDDERFRGRQVSVYTHSKQFAKILVERMQAAGYDARLWTGDVQSKQRDKLKAGWLASEFQYLVSVITSFSTGLDGFQNVCNRVVWVSEEDDNVANMQAIKRYWRSGNPAMLADFMHVKLVSEGTLETDVRLNNIEKTDVMRRTLAA
ncbi:hypothetical protein [Agromyces sp. NPDC058104]|uniref:hypothetical protein n=1 Tax=Agromyces sp. NPDC058104 TaxID=3346342 RepID=UPI0036D9D495